MIDGNSIVFVDIEVNPETGTIREYGAATSDHRQYRGSSSAAFSELLTDASYVCGHNLLRHDLNYIGTILSDVCPDARLIDTLPLSPLLFPQKPYHHLLKDDKLQASQMNNPLNDAKKARELFEDEVNAFRKLPISLRSLYGRLLGREEAFGGFFSWAGTEFTYAPEDEIRTIFQGQICDYAPLRGLIENTPVELAYALALIRSGDRHSITPPWVVRTYPKITNVMKTLRGTPCGLRCSYCDSKLDIRRRLKEIFGFDSFRRYEGIPLQEEATEAAVLGKSLLAVFPTGGGKSLTFQLPALMAGETDRGLTVVISPLQSLMKDQVDHLEEKGIADAVAINGLLDPLERKEAIDRVANGMASILYISPESLRSKTIESLLRSRNVVRFVIDEAHCFSAWGQDFRVDYLYIGDFIRKLQETKHTGQAIPVSCFTATAKQKVISDIREYFRQKLGLDLKLYATQAVRTNLRYAVLYKETDEEKYQEIGNLIQARKCATIIYVSRVHRTEQIAGWLREDGVSAEAYNGRMDAAEKIRVQNAFLSDRIQVIVATSAFGMGVDKKDVGLVIHYDISDSLENYVQEAGRAGRDQQLNAECYVLFNEEDLDKHFVLLNQTKLSLGEIQQVWRAIKELTRNRPNVNCSALEIARQAGWDDASPQMETRVTAALAALENAGYLERGKNVPHIYASSIQVPDVATAVKRLQASERFTEEQRNTARRIINYLISRKYTAKGTGNDAESRVDYLADRLGLARKEVVHSILLMREEGMLADHTDLTAYIRQEDTRNRSELILRRFARLEKFMLDAMPDKEETSLRELNDQAVREGIKTATVRQIKTILFFWTISGEYRKQLNADEERTHLERAIDPITHRKRVERRQALCMFIVSYLFEKSQSNGTGGTQEERTVFFSVRELQQAFNHPTDELAALFEATTSDIEQALMYLSKIQALSLEGGFLVSYNAMQINRLETDNRIKYKTEDYRLLNDFYQQRVQQIHIVGEYAHLMVRDYSEAQQFVSDYFQMDYRGFLSKYFKGTRRGEINRNITPEKYDKLFGSLSDVQREIIDDDRSNAIVVAAGPGSGKTRLLVHKLASLMMLEDVKHEQMLMLTFSREAATEFKSRLLALIGNAAYFIEIRTFHSYCFDLLGRIGNLEDAATVVRCAAEMIRNGEVEMGRITKSVLVIDEAQDMDADEFALVSALMKRNENMRVIAVGDDDQNIYGFRGSNSGFMLSLVTDYGARMTEMTENYRSDRAIVDMANAYAATIRYRMKRNGIQAVSKNIGSVNVYRYTGTHLEIPMLERLKAHLHEGSVSVLTQTNEQAERIAGYLQHQGIRARLIQSNDGFPLTNLAEIRYFLHQLDQPEDHGLIDQDTWKQAIAKLTEKWSESTCLPVCLNILNRFAQVNRQMYRRELTEFLLESNMEDFQENQAGQVTISTIHKAKGREFDHVSLVLNDEGARDDEDRRRIYVGLTRAKKSLDIHTRSSEFESFSFPGFHYEEDHRKYGDPDTILLRLNHRDVFLGCFRGKKKRILQMRAGKKLVPAKNGLMDENGVVLIVYSAAFKDRLRILNEKGYNVQDAVIRCIVAWKAEEDADETAILLPDVYLKKQTDSTD
ncbi:MAG: RecQ family ATP-dependent DNA helicase [Clostridia bacterium]|nr:RecQ family ATP-dependent DNA helicase [Clostridia bacterium]